MPFCLFIRRASPNPTPTRARRSDEPGQQRRIGCGSPTHLYKLSQRRAFSRRDLSSQCARAPRLRSYQVACHLCGNLCDSFASAGTMAPVFRVFPALIWDPDLGRPVGLPARSLNLSTPQPYLSATQTQSLSVSAWLAQPPWRLWTRLNGTRVLCSKLFCPKQTQ